MRRDTRWQATLDPLRCIRERRRLTLRARASEAGTTGPLYTLPWVPWVRGIRLAGAKKQAREGQGFLDRPFEWRNRRLGGPTYYVGDRLELCGSSKSPVHRELRTGSTDTDDTASSSLLVYAFFGGRWTVLVLRPCVEAASDRHKYGVRVRMSSQASPVVIHGRHPLASMEHRRIVGGGDLHINLRVRIMGPMASQHANSLESRRTLRNH